MYFQTAVWDRVNVSVSSEYRCSASGCGEDCEKSYSCTVVQGSLWPHGVNVSYPVQLYAEYKERERYGGSVRERLLLTANFSDQLYAQKDFLRKQRRLHRSFQKQVKSPVENLAGRQNKCYFLLKVFHIYIVQTSYKNKRFVFAVDKRLPAVGLTSYSAFIRIKST